MSTNFDFKKEKKKLCPITFLTNFTFLYSKKKANFNFFN